MYLLLGSYAFPSQSICLPLTVKSRQGVISLFLQYPLRALFVVLSTKAALTLKAKFCLSNMPVTNCHRVNSYSDTISFETDAYKKGGPPEILTPGDFLSVTIKIVNGWSSIVQTDLEAVSCKIVSFSNISFIQYRKLG